MRGSYDEETRQVHDEQPEYRQRSKPQVPGDQRHIEFKGGGRTDMSEIYLGIVPGYLEGHSQPDECG